MKTIIIKGAPKKRAVFQHKCQNCGCVFQFTHNEITEFYFNSCIDVETQEVNRLVEHWRVSCPNCFDRYGFPKSKPIRFEE